MGEFDASVHGGGEGRDCCCARVGGESFLVLVSAIDRMFLVGRSTELVRAMVAPVSGAELRGVYVSSRRADT